MAQLFVNLTPSLALGHERVDKQEPGTGGPLISYGHRLFLVEYDDIYREECPPLLCLLEVSEDERLSKRFRKG